MAAGPEVKCFVCFRAEIVWYYHDKYGSENRTKHHVPIILIIIIIINIMIIITIIVSLVSW